MENNQRDQQEIDAAEKYADRWETKPSVQYDMLRNAFLAGIEWLREKRAKKPDIEYYGG